MAATGTGFMIPPSASMRPPIITGVKKPGIAIVARMAASIRPCWNQTSLPAGPVCLCADAAGCVEATPQGDHR